MIFLYGSFLWLLVPLAVYLFKREVAQSFAQNLRWAVLALLIVALARPVVPQTLATEEIQAHSLVIALDLSVSMNAEDIKPSRIVAAKRSIKAFLDSNSHDQIGLIGFTTNPLLLSPPTTDHALLKIALENIKSEYILTKGTDLKKLLKKVAKFQEEEKKLVLFTDGGDEVLSEELVDFVAKENIKIIAIGMATKQGDSVKQKNAKLLVDKKGNIVVSKLNASLRILAEQSGGGFIRYSSVDNTVSYIKNWLEAEQLNNSLERESRDYFELSFVPLFLALILFFLSGTRFSKKLLAIFLLLGMNVQAEELITREHWGEGVKVLNVEASSNGFFDAYYLNRAYAYYEDKAYEESQKEIYKIKNRSLEAELLLTHIFYKQEKYKLAKSLLLGIKSANKKVKQQVYYELGNCEAKLSYMEKAKNYYVKALQLGEDEDAMHNLRIVLFRVKEESSKVGYTNPSQAEKSKEKSDKLEVDKEESSSKKDEALGSSGGSGSKKSKNSSIKVVKTDTESSSKRILSSKAYDLINEGYIREEKPW